MNNKIDDTIHDPSFREQVADTVYRTYGGPWGNALGMADLLMPYIQKEIERQVLEGRIDEPLTREVELIEDEAMTNRSKVFWGFWLYLTLCSVAFGIAFSGDLILAKIMLALICLLLSQIVMVCLLINNKG